MGKFVELYCDELDGLWKITIWTISTKDFDPFQCEFENYSEETVDIYGHGQDKPIKQLQVLYAEPHIHKAALKQREVANDLKRQGHEVHVNTANPNSFFYVVPKWLVQMIVGGKGNDQAIS